MTVPPVAGDFLAAADRHIAAVARFRGELPDDALRSAAHQLSRMATTATRFLADLPDEGGALPNVGREAGRRSSSPGWL
jgi:hypothetical protein